MKILPTARIELGDGGVIIAELYPDAAPNTVNSFIWAANNGFYDDYAVQRIEPGVVIDASYRAFGHEECKFCIENEALKPGNTGNPKIDLGSMCMGGYDADHISGCEFFMPLARVERWEGSFPVFGHIIYGTDRVLKLGEVKLQPSSYQPMPGYTMLEPVRPQIIKRVRVDCHGCLYPDPIQIQDGFVPDNWLY